MTSLALDETAAVQQRRPVRLLTRWIPFLFLLPVAVELIVFRYVPTFSAFYHSFTNWDGRRKDAFIGLRNYFSLFEDAVFRDAFVNMVEYTFLRTVGVLLFAFIAAELIFSIRNERVRMFWKIAFVIPLVVPRSVVYLMWAFIYDPQVGLVNEVLHLVGLDHEDRDAALELRDVELAGRVLGRGVRHLHRGNAVERQLRDAVDRLHRGGRRLVQALEDVVLPVRAEPGQARGQRAVHLDPVTPELRLVDAGAPVEQGAAIDRHRRPLRTSGRTWHPAP